ADGLGRGDPHLSIVATRHRGDRAVEQAVVGSHRGDASIFQHADAVFGTGPDAAVAVFDDRSDVASRKALRGREALVQSVAPTDEPVAADANPDGAISIFEQRARVNVWKIFGDCREPHAVEADGARPGADPQIPVAALQQGGDVVIGETLVYAP